jgi:methyl-accepting chemotaxis protein
MGDKSKGFRGTISNAAEIIKSLGSPEVYKSLERIYQTTKEARGMMESLREPEMVKNIDNIRLTAEAIERTSNKIENSVLEIKKIGILEEASELLEAARNTLTSGEYKNNISEVTSAIKEMLESIRALTDELRLTITSSRKSGLIHNADEAMKEASSFYHTVRD